MPNLAENSGTYSGALLKHWRETMAERVDAPGMRMSGLGLLDALKKIGVDFSSGQLTDTEKGEYVLPVHTDEHIERLNAFAMLLKLTEEERGLLQEALAWDVLRTRLHPEIYRRYVEQLSDGRINPLLRFREEYKKTTGFLPEVVPPEPEL